MIEFVKDKYLNWRTGLSKQERDYRNWEAGNIVYNANTIENRFMHFKYILPVSTLIFNDCSVFGWYPTEEFREYMYPARTLGDNAVYYFARGYRDQWDGKFHINDLRSEQDQVFVATNNEEDAIMIALKYS